MSQSVWIQTHQRKLLGSGVIEAGCKTVVGARLKQSGMFWTVRGANAIIALRCCTSTVASRTIGRHVARLDLHFHVAPPKTPLPSIGWGIFIASPIARTNLLPKLARIYTTCEICIDPVKFCTGADCPAPLFVAPTQKIIHSSSLKHLRAGQSRSCCPSCYLRIVRGCPHRGAPGAAWPQQVFILARLRCV